MGVAMLLQLPGTAFYPSPFASEAEFEAAVLSVSKQLFGENRYYIDVKRLIGNKKNIQNIPDGYLIDLSSSKQPRLFVVENELANHDALRHIAVQVLGFSLSFEDDRQRVKSILKEEIIKQPYVLEACQTYAHQNGFQNIDFLLETIIYKAPFSVLVVIDELSDKLETLLGKRFRFVVEMLTLERYRNEFGEIIYNFDPFLQDVIGSQISQQGIITPPIDFAEIDTIVVPAQEDGFQETFIGENRWYQIRIHNSMIDKLKYIAAYRVAPVSAVTHIAEIKSIEQWEDTAKYVVNFSAAARTIDPIKFVPNGKVIAPRGPRYTSISRLTAASNLDEAF